MQLAKAEMQEICLEEFAAEEAALKEKVDWEREVEAANRHAFCETRSKTGCRRSIKKIRLDLMAQAILK